GDGALVRGAGQGRHDSGSEARGRRKARRQRGLLEGAQRSLAQEGQSEGGVAARKESSCQEGVAARKEGSCQEGVAARKEGSCQEGASSEEGFRQEEGRQKEMSRRRP